MPERFPAPVVANQPLGPLPPAKTRPGGSAGLHSGVPGLDLPAAAAVLERYRRRGRLPAVERMAWLCAELGHPEKVAPAVHVTGTNGKGSTTRMVTAVLRAEGLTVGQYVSPHLLEVTERIDPGYGPIRPGAFCALVEELVPLFEAAPGGCGEPVTHFDALTAMALVAFDRARPDALVIEVGIGGRSDATNVIDARVAVMTNVDLDHTELLGSTRELIAEEKAGIIKPDAVAILAEPTPGVAEVFERRCREVGATPWLAGRDFHARPAPAGETDITTPHGLYRVRVPFRGPHQVRNAAGALAAAGAFLGRAPHPDAVEAAWSGLANPGHFELLGRPTRAVVDVAHNPHGIGALVEALAEARLDRELVVVFSVGRDKNASAMLAALRPLTARLLVTQAPPDAPSRNAADLAVMATELGFPRVETHPDPLAAVSRAAATARPGQVVLSTGSHYWIGAVYGRLLELFGPPTAPGAA